MNLIEQPNVWSCLPTAFSMVFQHYDHEINLDRVLQDIGHDGSEIINPQLPSPWRYKSFHIQELIDVGIGLGYYTLHIETNPTIDYTDSVEFHPLWNIDICIQRLLIYLKLYDGVMVGKSSDQDCEFYHAVAWNKDEEKIYNPKGVIQGVDEFQIKDFYAVIKSIQD